MADRPSAPVIHPTDTHRHAVRGLLRRARAASLGTVLPAGAAAVQPYVSLVTLATDDDGSPLLLLSALADHTRALEAESRACLLVEEAAGLPNPQTGPRASILGRLERLPSGPARDRAATRFLARHPAAALYAGFGDFAFWRMTVEKAHFVGGFARAVWLGSDFLTPAPLAEAVAALVPPPELAARAVARAGLVGTGWTIAAWDADGLDLVRPEDDGTHRLAFEPPLDAPLDPARWHERLAGGANVAAQ